MGHKGYGGRASWKLIPSDTFEQGLAKFQISLEMEVMM
jgi:hypothetical protein